MFFKKQKPKSIGYLRRQISLFVVLGLLLAGLFSYTRVGAPEQALAATSSNLNIQARLYTASGSVVPDGYYNIEFKMYDAVSAGSLLWTETWYDSNGVTAGNDNRVRVVNGYMSVQLGTHTALPSVNWDDNIWISLNVGGTTQTASPTYDGEMSPRIKLTAVPFALAARNVSSGNTSTASTNSGNISIQTGNATGATSNSGNITLDVGTATQTAGTISVGTANTSGITIGRVGVITDIAGNLTVSGSQFTNNGSTVNGAQALGDFASGGSIGSAATTVDVDTAFTINQTTAGQTLTLPSPTVTTAGRIVYILNVGSTGFTMESVTIGAGYGQIYIWNGSSWRLGATGGSGTIALQAAYDGGNTITSTDGRDIDITLANTATDANFVIDIATSSTSEFKIQANGTDVLQIGSAGQLQLDTQGVTGGILLGGDTNIYRSAANTLKTDDDFAVGSNLTITASTGALTTSGNISTTGSGTITSAGLLTGQAGLTVTGANVNLNASSNFATNINTGTSTGAVSIGNGVAGTITIQSGTGISLGGATSVTGSNTLTVGTGLTSLGGNLDVTGSSAFKKGTDFSTTGTTNDASFGDVSLVRLTGASAQTVTGISGGRDGEILTIVNAASQAATITNNDAGSIAANRIITGTGASITLNAGGSITLIYDSAASLWRVTGSVGFSTGNFIQNTTSPQTADFNITGSGTVGTNLTVTGLITANGNLTLQTGDTFTMNGDAFTDLTGSGLIVSSNALTVDDSTATGFFRNGGNSFAGAATLGTNDANVLNFETAGTNRFQISSSTSSLTGQGNTFINSSGGALHFGNSSLANGIAIGTGSASSNTINIGGASTGTPDATNLSLQATTIIRLGTSGVANTVQIGNTTGAVTQTINIGNNSTASSTSNVNIGSTAGGTTAISGNFSTLKGTDYSTVAGNNAALGNASLVRLTGASAQTITGIASGTDGRRVTLLNASGFTATISNNSGSSIAANRITTGTGADISLLDGSSIELIYDSAASLWRVTGSVGFSTGNFIQNTTSPQTADFNITGDGVIGDDLAVNGDALTTDDTTFYLLNTTATTINAFGAATTLSLGAGSGTTTVNNNLTVTGLLTANGNLTLQNGDTFTVGGDAFTDLTGSGLIVSSNALTVDATSATGFFRNGGNTFGSAATLGTNDNTALNLETANTNRFVIASNSSKITGQGITEIDATAALFIGGTGSNGIAIGNNGVGANEIIIGNTTAATVLNIQGGSTGGINIGSVSSSTVSSTIHVGDTSNATGSQAITIGSTAAQSGNLTTIQGGSSTTSGSEAIRILPNTAGSIAIGATAGTGTITLGKSTATNTISIGSAVPGASSTQTINIGNASMSTASSSTIVNILSGTAGTNGTASLLMGNNDRVTQIDIGNVAADAARTLNFGTGNNIVGIDTLNIGTGNTSVIGGKTINIGTGTPTGSGTNLITIGSVTNASATTINAGTGNLNLSPSGSSNTGVVVRPVTANSTAAFKIQDQAGTSTLFNADTTNMRVSVGSIGTATGQLYVSGRLPTTHTGTVNTDGGSYDVYVQDKYAYVVNQSVDTLQIFDISNPASPVSVSSIATGDAPTYVFVQGRYAYVTTLATSGTLQIFDVSNPTTPTALSTLSLGGGNARDVFVQGRYAYVANTSSNTMQVVDVSNPSTPTIAGSVAASGIQSIHVQGRYAYVTRSSTLEIYDVSNPASPVSAGSVATGTTARGIFVQGRYAYVTTTGSDTLEIYDVSNPASPVSAGSFATGGDNDPWSVYVQGRYAYVANQVTNTLRMVDVSNPASPSSIGTVTGGGSASGLHVQGRYAYLASYAGNLRTYDLGGAYTQQLEAGGIESSTLSVISSASIGGNLSVQGGLTVLDSSNFSGGLSVGSIFDVTGSAALRKGTDFSTTGSSNNVNFGEVSLVRLTGASAQTITGIANGRDGEILTIVNAAAQSATISDNSGSSSAANRIITGTGADITLTAGGSITLIYDSTASLWRVTGSVGFSTGNFIQNGTIQQTSANFNIKSASSGSVVAVIQGTTGQTADLLQVKDEDGTNRLSVNANSGFAVRDSIGYTSTSAFSVIAGGGSTIFGVNTTSSGVYTQATTFDVFNSAATTINAFGAASAINLGAAGATITNPGSLNIRATGTNTLDLDTTGAGTIGLGDTNATTIGIGNTTAATVVNIQGGTSGSINLGSVGSSTLASTVNIANTSNATGAQTINIGSAAANASSQLNLFGGSGASAIVMATASTGTIRIGGTTQTGTIQLGASTQSNIVSIGSAALNASQTQTINIGNQPLSAAGSSTIVNILSGTAGTNGTASLLMGNNDRVTQIDIGNVAADAARTLNFGTGNNTVGIDTLNIGTGNTTVANGKTINIGTGTPTGSGTNLITIGSLANGSQTTIQGGTGTGGITLTAAGSASTGIMVKNSTNSTAAFQIQNASSQSLFVADTTNQRLAVGPAAVPANGVLTVGTNTTAASGGIFFGTDTNLYRYGAGQLASDGSVISTTGSFYTTAAGAGLIFGAGNTSGIINALANGAGDLYIYNGSVNPIATFSQTGTALFRNSTNSTVAFQIQSSSGSDTMFIADTTTTNKIKIGNSTGTGTSTTIFQLDAAASAPFGTGQTAYLGSMYYDSTQGKLQCYESRNGTAAWGACGSAPNNIITLTPEYTGAVLNGTGVGTLTADFCSNQASVLVVGTLCASGEARNFYKWTSPQGTDQTYGVYVTYKLPSTFSGFSDANTIKLTALTDNTTNANATLQVFRKNVSGGTIVSCGSATTINNAANTWQQTSFGGDETACGFVGGDYVIFKINVTAKSSGNVYVENLDFTYTNQ